jgi:protein-tyrosine-phosphatase
MTSRPWNVLILCTGNSARSILGEAIVTREGQGRLIGYSAGSQPKTQPHPHALALLADRGYDSTRFWSKTWSEFASQGAPVMDLTITVCDNAAGETCPLWPGRPATAHWGLEDPAAVEGDDKMIRAAFERTYGELEARVRALVALPFETMAPADLKARLAVIGAMAGATDQAKRG